MLIGTSFMAMLCKRGQNSPQNNPFLFRMTLITGGNRENVMTSGRAGGLKNREPLKAD
jgi:hypothetical protein